MEEKWQEFKKNVDWEQFTGVKLFAWLGGLALFIGAIFFVKYSIDNNLIPPQLRLAIGALVGLVMIISSLIIDRERYKTTFHTMAAGGIAVLYAVSFTATVYYGFLPKLAGFGLFALISAAAFVLAVFHQRTFHIRTGCDWRLRHASAHSDRASQPDRPFHLSDRRQHRPF